MDITVSDARRIRTVVSRLLAWYDLNGRIYSWRSPDATNYLRIVSELLLQRTRADTVAKFLPSFLKTYSSWSDLAQASTRDLENSLAPIGLQARRADSLSSLSKRLTTEGEFPESREQIESLPGIGQYVANAIQLFIFNKPRPLLDTNMARVIERYFRKRKLADIRYDPWLQAITHKAVTISDPKSTNWAFLDLGAIVCLPRLPKCEICPLKRGCGYKRQIKH